MAMNANAPSPEEIAEFERRATGPRDLSDPIWRLCNLYSILADGRDVQFRPHAEQRWMLICIYIRGWLRILNPKARQRGMSTLLALIALDRIVWTAGYHVALIDKTAEDAVKKHKEKVIYGWERLPESIRVRLNAKPLTQLLTIKGSTKDSPESTFSAGINFRGGTVSMLWISEWGAIQDTDRTRSAEIKAGAMPAIELAEEGLCVIETTWKGGLDGELGPYVQSALDTPEEQKGPKSWRIVFIPWWTAPEYSRDYGYIDAASAAYFLELEKRGISLTEGQKRWYAEQRRTASSARKLKEEYPSFAEECWTNEPVGSIYGKWITEARGEGRISNFTPPRDYPVHTFWDIGHPLNTVAILAQMTPMQIRIVDVLMEVDMTMEQRAAWLKAQPWDYGNHYFPWDSDSDGASIGTKPIDTFRRALGPTCIVVRRCHSVWDGISVMRQNFNRCVFVCDSLAGKDDRSTPGARMKQFVEFLARFRADRETSTGVAKDVPVHDRYSHCSSALAQLGLTIASGSIQHANMVGSRVESQPRKPVVIYAGGHY
jgi:hypothetical protein